MTAIATEPRCSIARSLAVLGERWTLLIVREAFWGRTRFSEFRARLGVSPDILASRLATLVEYDVLERRSYREEGAREREEYVLTEAGRDLLPVLAAIADWGNAHRPSELGPTAEYRERATDRPVDVRFVTTDGRVLDPEQVAMVHLSVD
jgi:DNA-binding HxlR family transcriptional regulator